jgi:hypothetical protein
MCLDKIKTLEVGKFFKTLEIKLFDPKNYSLQLIKRLGSDIFN